MEINLEKFSVFILKNADQNKGIEFAKSLKIDNKHIHVFEELKIDEARKIKYNSEIQHSYIECFVIGEIKFDAQNAMLKITEETPDKTIFIFYKPDVLLDTIYSRAQIVNLPSKKGVDKMLLKTLKENDKQKLLKFLFSLKTKENILSLLENLVYLFTSEGKIDKAEKMKEYLKTYREYNLNENLLLANIFSEITE